MNIIMYELTVVILAWLTKQKIFKVIIITKVNKISYRKE